MSSQTFPGYTPVPGCPGLYRHIPTGNFFQAPRPQARPSGFAQSPPFQRGMPQPSFPVFRNAYQQPPQIQQVGYQANFPPPPQFGHIAYPQYAPIMQHHPLPHVQRVSQPAWDPRMALGAPAPPQGQSHQMPEVPTMQDGQPDNGLTQYLGGCQATAIDLTQDEDEVVERASAHEAAPTVSPLAAVSPPEEAFSRAEKQNLKDRVAHLKMTVQEGADPLPFCLLNTFDMNLSTKQKLKYCKAHWPSNEAAEADLVEMAQLSPNFSTIWCYRLSWAAAEDLPEGEERDTALARIEREKEELRGTCLAEYRFQRYGIDMRQGQDRETHRRDGDSRKAQDKRDKEAAKKAEREEKAAFRQQAREDKLKRKASEPPKKRGRPPKIARVEQGDEDADVDLLAMFAADPAFGSSVYQDAPTPSSPRPPHMQPENPSTLPGAHINTNLIAFPPQATPTPSRPPQDVGSDIDASGEVDDEYVAGLAMVDSPMEGRGECGDEIDALFEDDDDEHGSLFGDDAA